jgi:pyruvate dehydrogenase (quinone)
LAEVSQSVAGALVDVLERVGVKHVFGLIGDSPNPLGDAIRPSKTEWIGVRHEKGGPEAPFL